MVTKQFLIISDYTTFYFSLFLDLVEPQDIENGWKAKVSPPEHPISQYEFDVLIGADGKRNTLQGFKRKEFRGKLAIAITANFIHRCVLLYLPTHFGVKKIIKLYLCIFLSNYNFTRCFKINKSSLWIR